MPARILKEFLDRRLVRYVSIQHSRAYSAQEVASSIHVAGRDFAKSVIVWVANEMVMIVVPANRRIILGELKELLATDHVRLASETEFRDRFPDCEIGAMPPFGKLYGLQVFISAELMDEEEIAFNAGSHTEVIKMSYDDYVLLVNPMVLDFITV